MKIIFAGANCVVLEHLARMSGIEIQFCLFHKDFGDSWNFETLCEVYGLKYAIVKNNEEVYKLLKNCKKPDIGVSSSFDILHEKNFSIPRQGFVNIHPSYLPSYKGANPFYHMLINNEKTGGVSIHQITKDVDGGKIYARAKYNISFNDTIVDLVEKANASALKLLDNNLVKIIQGKVRGMKNTGGSYFPPVKERQWINPEKSLLYNYNLIRSQTLYGGCLFELENKTYRVVSAKIETVDSDINNKKSLAKKKGISLLLKEGKVLIMRYEKDE